MGLGKYEGNHEHLPCFLDFEASSLDLNSYPIQVAWSLPDGSVYDRFIRPCDTWKDWSYASEEIHGIRREFLFDVGRAAREVAEELNAALDPYNIAFADALQYDESWLQTLYLSAGIEPTFVLGDFNQMLADTRPELFKGLRHHRPDSEWARLKDLARSRVPGRRHAAQNDVKFLLELFQLAEQRA